MPQAVATQLFCSPLAISPRRPTLPGGRVVGVGVSELWHHWSARPRGLSHPPRPDLAPERSRAGLAGVGSGKGDPCGLAGRASRPMVTRPRVQL